MQRALVAPCRAARAGVRRAFSASAAAASDAASRPVPKPPKMRANAFFYKGRGFVDADPMPERPPEDDIATCTAYFELLANLHAAGKSSGDAAALETVHGEITKRLARLKDPRSWVMLVATLSQRRQVATGVAAAVEARFAASPESWADLDGPYLAALVHAMGVQGAKSPEFFAAATQRAVALGALAEADYDNFARGCAAAGVAVPPDVARVPHA